MPAPDQILKLVDRFTANIADLKSANQNESSTRQDYIDPFFRALGWDVGNQQGRSEAEKEVKVEVSIRVDDARKAPDYGFYHNGELQFFVEAKKPIVNLKYGTNAAFQIRRYAWSTKKIALSILTDFEELAIYDCRTEPLDKDSADTARLKYFDYKEYPDKWDEIANLFSREAVAANSLDSYTASLKNQKGIVTVDAAFLKLIEYWRELLAKNLARRNPNLSQRELNSAVQTTIDRIIFLRFCEERDIQPYEEMKQLLDYSGIYERLCEIFNRADVRYNSGLFHLKDKDSRDHWMLGLKIDDAPLKEILYKLYYPAPYAFKAIPVEILGQVYEQFLGKVITLSPSHEASIEEKPEVRKAGGVYYTPGYIVEYIVKNTVGKLLEGQNPDQAAKLKILDPACGSGSFLLGAYQFLLDWYLNYYVSHNPTDHYKKKRLRSISTDTGILWQLTTDEKKRILLNNLYGVDIDTQAVEVTKLSLLLKMVEDESAATQQLQLLQERLLPDLDNNIKCGNSLIGPEINEGKMVFPDFEEQLRVNAFDWQSGFPAVFKQGGFDAVIGNPPYVRQESLGEFKAYFQQTYKVYHGMADLYTYFFEKGVSLLRQDGIFSFIVANKWMRANYGEPLRHWLKQQHIDEILDFGDLPVFQSATTYPCIIKITKTAPVTTFEATQVETLNFGNLSDYVLENHYTINQTILEDGGWSMANAQQQAILKKLRETGLPFGKYVKGRLLRGILTGLNEAFVIDNKIRELMIGQDPKSAELIKPFVAGRDIKRYQQLEEGRYLIIIPNGWTRVKSGNAPDSWEWLKQNYPAIAGHLEKFSVAAQKRGDKGEYWWELRSCDYYEEFEKPKMLLPDISLRGNFTLDKDKNFYCVNTAYIIGDSSPYLLGILNSQLITFFYSNLSSSYRGGYLRFIYQYIEQLPIRVINFDDPADKARHDDMVRLVERMLDLYKRVAAANLSHEKTALQRQIEATDKQIDQLVYQLYQLTPEEITIVEG